MRFQRVLLAMSFFVMLFWAGGQNGHAAVPLTMNYQGTLTDNTGSPVSGTKAIKFALYTVASGGTAFWTETHKGITLQGGKFSVTFGAPVTGTATPLVTTNFSGETYVGITVCTSDAICTDAEMAPRQKFTSVPYALQAGTVDAAVLPVGVIVMWSGSVTAIPTGWALCNGANGTPDLQDRFIVGAGSGYVIGNAGGGAAINLQHSHNVNSHAHTISHTHTYAGKTGPPSDQNSYDETNEDAAANMQHTHAYSGTTSQSSDANTGAESPGTNNQLSATQDIRPPYYALAFIMKL